jgi:hypothetical protein
LKDLEAKVGSAKDGAKKKITKRIKSKQANIYDYYRVITQLRREREQAAEKYKKILIEFRDLTTE